MDAWWRDQPLDGEEKNLFEALLKAHHQSVFRANTSTIAVALAADSSGDLTKAIAAALLTVGGKHAPLERTYRFLLLEDPAREVARILKTGEKVPGWGGTFQKDGPDPLWAEVHDLLARTAAFISIKLNAVTATLAEHSKQLWPNPSAYTAAVAIRLKMPTHLVWYPFIAGRLSGWAQIANEHLGKAGQ